MNRYFNDDHVSQICVKEWKNNNWVRILDVHYLAFTYQLTLLVGRPKFGLHMYKWRSAFKDCLLYVYVSVRAEVKDYICLDLWQHCINIRKWLGVSIVPITAQMLYIVSWECHHYYTCNSMSVSQQRLMVLVSWQCHYCYTCDGVSVRLQRLMVLVSWHVSQDFLDCFIQCIPNSKM